MAAGDRLLGGEDVGLALGVGSGVLTVACLCGTYIKVHVL